ncbi:hypothetical protein [Burkholderia sp. AW49-1]
MKILTNRSPCPPETHGKANDGHRVTSDHHARSAVLYRGLVKFAYAGGLPNATATSIARTRQMRVTLVRNRMTPGRAAHLEIKQALDIRGDNNDHPNELPGITDSDDRRDGQRQSHQFRVLPGSDTESTDQRESAFPSRETQHRRERMRPEFSIEHHTEGKYEVMLERSVNQLLDMRDTLAADPGRSVRTAVYRFLIDQIASDRHSDALPAVSISKLHGAFHRAVTERASATAHGAKRDAPPERVQHLNALLGLLLLNTCRPTPPTHCQHAFARLLAMQRSALCGARSAAPA